MPLTVTVTLTSGADSVTFVGPAPGAASAPTIPGVVSRTQGGSLVKYRVGPAYHEVTLTLPHLSDAEYESLDAFFTNHWSDSWTYTDEEGRTYTAQFLDSALPFTKNSKGSWQLQLKLQLSQALG